MSRQSSGRRKCPNPSKTKNKHTLTDRLVYLEQKMTETVTKAKPKKFLCGEDSCSSTNKSGGFQHPARTSSASRSHRASIHASSNSHHLLLPSNTKPLPVPITYTCKGRSDSDGSELKVTFFHPLIACYIEDYRNTGRRSETDVRWSSTV